MARFLLIHTEAFLIALAVLFIVGIIASFSWGIGNIVGEINMALKYTPSQTKTGFDLQDAAKLDWRGLVSTSTPATTATP